MAMAQEATDEFHFDICNDVEFGVSDDLKNSRKWKTDTDDALSVVTAGREEWDKREGNKPLLLRDRQHIIAPTNIRKIGTLLTVELTKGNCGGLGFSITTRDNLDGIDSPIYIKHILPGGVAFHDGRLRAGDRLLEVDNIPMTGKSQSEAVAILRNIQINHLAHLVVSRQKVDQNDKKNFMWKETPRICVLEKDPTAISESNGCSSREDASGLICRNSDWETLTLKVVHQDSESQLGLKVKRSRRGGTIIGLQVKAILSEGVAAKDGQLHVGDYLVKVNGISLIDISQSTAVDIFRSVLQKSQENFGFISITVIRYQLIESSFPAKSECPFIIRKQYSDLCLDIDCYLSDIISDQELRSCTFKHSKEDDDTSAGCNQRPIKINVLSSGVKPCDFVSRPFHDLNKKSTRKHPDNSLTDASDHTTSQEEVSDFQLQDGNLLEPSWKFEGEPPAPFFQRAGFGRRSISEKRMERHLLSGSEIYQSIKRSRKNKEHMTSVHNRSKEKQVSLCDASTETFQLEPQTFPLMSQACDPVTANERPTDGVDKSSVISASNLISEASLSASNSAKTIRKFDTALIKGFIKKGFAGLFRSETQTRTSQSQNDGSPDDGNANKIDSNVASGQKEFSNNIPRIKNSEQLKQPHIMTDMVTNSRNFPTLPNQVQHYANTLPVRTPNFYFPGQLLYQSPRFHMLSVTTNTLPLQCCPLFPYGAVEPRFQRQHNNPAVPLSRTYFVARPSIITQEQSYVNERQICKNRSAASYIGQVPNSLPLRLYPPRCGDNLVRLVTGCQRSLPSSIHHSGST